MIKEYLDKNDNSTTRKRSKSVFTKKENDYDYEKIIRNDDFGDLKKDIHQRITKLKKGDWEDQVEVVECMFRHAVTGEWYSLLKW